MILSQDQTARLQYIANHDPIRYVVKKKFLFYYIETLKGERISCSLSADTAQIKCDCLNSIYSLGYLIGVNTVLKEILSDDFE